MKKHFTTPILTIQTAKAVEKGLFSNEENREWRAMNNAGRGIGREILKDFRELKELPKSLRILVLAGKGHNGGDALLAADEILQILPTTEVDVLLVTSGQEMRNLAQRSLTVLSTNGGGQVQMHLWKGPEFWSEEQLDYDIVIDGLLGLQFRKPLRQPISDIVGWINHSVNASFRASIDLPTGLGEDFEEGDLVFISDFTYLPGIAKKPVFEPTAKDCVGRIRFLDLGFLSNEEEIPVEQELLTKNVLSPLRVIRPAQSDKRTYGHVFLLGGSARMPGAITMSTMAALYSGVGLVTAFVPQSVMPGLAPSIPEAMWVPWSENDEGALNTDTYYYLANYLKRETVLIVGPGMGDHKDTIHLLQRIAGEVPLHLVLDADALRPEIIAELKNRPPGSSTPVLTPHVGEFKRLAGLDSDIITDEVLKGYAAEYRCVVVLKGPVTRITDGKNLYYSTFGSPVLARGGSGDLLSGLIGGVLSARMEDPLAASCLVVAWHGIAAECLARESGHWAVRTTDLLKHLSHALRND